MVCDPLKPDKTESETKVFVAIFWCSIFLLYLSTRPYLSFHLDLVFNDGCVHEEGAGSGVTGHWGGLGCTIVNKEYGMAILLDGWLESNAQGLVETGNLICFQH